MFRFPGICACVLLIPLFAAGNAFAVGEWIMEWYALDPVQGTTGIAEGIDTDWIDNLFGMPEAELTEFGHTPGPNDIAEIKIQGEDGSIDYQDGTYTIEAGGADIWGTSDAFRFTYKELDGDFEVELKAESLEQTNDWAKIGPMVRQSSDANSQYVFMLARALEGNKYFQERMAKGGSATGNGGEVADAAGFPHWLKITRDGDDFTGSVSADGNNWQDVGTTTLAMRDPVLVGIAVTSHSTGNITTGAVSELAIDGKEPDFDDMISEDIGTLETEVEELGWHVGNLGDINDDRNLSNGIYGGKNGDMSNYVFYGIVDVISPSKQTTTLNLAQDDDAKVWINGELVITSTGWTGGATITRPFDVELDKGHNIMMVKVSEGGGGDYLNARFEAENLTFSTDFAGFSVSPEGKQSTMWGGVKIR